MNKKTLLTSVLIVLFFSSSVLAESAGGPEQGSGKLRSRVAERIAKQADKIDNAKSDHLISKCTKAQVKIKKAQIIAEKHYKIHDKKYLDISTKTSLLIESLKAKNQSTAELEAVFLNTQKLENQLAANFQDYINAVYDAGNIECQTDPTGFMVSLDDARTKFKTLREARKALRANIMNELRPALQALKDKNN